MFFDIVFYIVLLMVSFSVRFYRINFILNHKLLSGLIPIGTYALWILLSQYFEKNVNDSDLLNSYLNLDGFIYFGLSIAYLVLSLL
jgi:hypothetical protein